MSDDVGFSTDQLMELAGLSCASAIFDAYPPSTHARVLVVCGPGNNGGDGLVTARHLVHFGYQVTLHYPKPSKNSLLVRLTKQALVTGVTPQAAMPGAEVLATDFDAIVDAVFGFSFKAGEVRAPFDAVIATLKAAQVPLISLDIPSGWDVDAGDVSGNGLQPQMLISLTAPKQCAARLLPGTKHYVGGRYVPRSMFAAYGVEPPAYQGSMQFARLA